jgi:hypothetical protein
MGGTTAGCSTTIDLGKRKVRFLKPQKRAFRRGLKTLLLTRPLDPDVMPGFDGETAGARR